ncbi:phage tail tube protein [Pseudomonas sp. XK-1]|uniref:phage tail tube protein n=1 Tax=Pseudomonas sp. XK-1 TaxID=3136019 RepID=UPI00311A105A
MPQIDRSFAGEGIIYARAYQSADPLLDIGNCDTFNLSFTTNQTKLPNYRGGGGNRNTREVVTDVVAAIGMYDLTATNVARVTRATVTAVAAGVVTAEVLACAGVEGELIPFKNLPDLSVAPVIVTAADAALVAGTDYLLSPHGIIVTAGSAITVVGIKATYTKLAADAMQLLNGSQVELEFYIAGLNDAQSGEPFSLRPRRAKLGLINQLNVFGQEYIKLEANAELLADPLVISNDISKFCEMQMVNKAA